MYVVVNSTANEIPKAIVTRFRTIELYLKHLYFLLVMVPFFCSRASACIRNSVQIIAPCSTVTALVIQYLLVKTSMIDYGIIGNSRFANNEFC